MKENFNITISDKNTKMGKIPSISFPAVITCRHNAPCAGLCYALRLSKVYQNVAVSYKNNLKAYIEKPKKFFKVIENYLTGGTITYRYFRFFVSGDFPDLQFLGLACKLASRHKKIKFLAFTKKYELINDYIKNGGIIPSNFNIVFSGWGDEIEVNNPFNLPMAKVRFKNKEQHDLTGEEKQCEGNCAECLDCWNLKKGECTVFNQH